MRIGGIDYEFSPVTIDLLARFAQGSDHVNDLAKMDVTADDIVERVINIDDYTKGLIIIDLLTLTDALRQALTISKLPKWEDS